MNYDPPKHLDLLTTLDEAGQSEYPDLVALAYFPVTSVEERMAVAMKAYQSLVIRLLVRRPLRTRNGCDRQIDGNLCCESGHWTIQFRAEEMEKERAHRRPRVYRVIFPEDLVSQLEEFLAVWRPMLPGRDLAELFTTLAGRPFSGLALNNGVRKTIYAHTGRATDVRQVRAIWATEFLKQAGDFAAEQRCWEKQLRRSCVVMPICTIRKAWILN